MKTLILASVSAVALLAAGTASAQAVPYPGLVTADNAAKSSQIRQNGVSSSATVDQTGASTGWSYIFQGGPNFAANDGASLTQSAGQGSRSVILQDDTIGASNTADPKSTMPTAGHNSAVVVQSGTNQESGIEQRGGTNFANTTQSGIGDGVKVLPQANVYAPPGEASQTIAPSSYLNAADGAFVDQIGTGNGSTITTSGSYDLAVVQQTGTTNYAKTNQSSDSYDSSKIDQRGAGLRGASTGLSNGANVDQQFGSNNASTISQRGTSNYAGVKQYFGNSNKSFARQVGTNTALITQTGSSNTSTTQQGADDLSMLADFGGPTTGNSALVDQSGYGNSSTVNQGASNNGADVSQAGQLSTSIVNQGAGTDFFGGSNYTTQVEGTGNYAKVRQTSGAYQAFSQIDQRSVNNSASVTQSNYADVSAILQSTGNGHVADVTQGTARDFSLVIQAGAGNYALVKQ